MRNESREIKVHFKSTKIRQNTMEFVADSDPNAAKKINDAEDLEDTLDVMETIVDQLKEDITNKMDLEVAMNQYINLED
jgi:hypothetical protein